jgi:hypothetical protein
MENEITGAADSGDAFTAEEQAMFDAQMDDGSPSEPAGGIDPAVGAAGAPEPVAPAGEAAAPGEIVDPETDEGGADENKGKFVRHGAFHQERELRKAAQRERDEFRVNLARMEERLRILSEGGQAPAQPGAAAPQPAVEPETPPDPNEDIFGYVKHLEKQIRDIHAGQTQLTEAQKLEQTQRAETAQRNEVLTAYQGDVRRVMTAQPEFAEAYNHLLTTRIEELKLLGVPEGEAVQAVRDEEFSIAQAAIRAGQSPAERLMQIAKIRGLAPKAAAPAAPAAPVETAAEKAARISAGQAASKSLSGAGGAAAGELTMEMLLSMSEAEFEKASAANPARVRALMGG